MPKLTHVMYGTGAGITGGVPIAVYGKDDLKARQKAADEAGVKVTVRKVSRAEREGKR